VTANSDAS